MTGTRHHLLPSQGDYVSGCKMPSHATIEAADIGRRQAAELGSTMLLEALDRYFRRGGKG